MKTLFTTVDKTGKLIPTTGTYIIARPTNKEVVTIYSDSYKDGVAEDTGVYQKGDIIYVYPNGYVGSATKSPDNILLNENAIGDALQEKEDAINSRLTPLKPQ